MIKYIKTEHQNLYIILISIFIAFWFIGITDLIRYFLPNRTILTSIILCIIAILFFLSDDSELSELHEITQEPDNKNKQKKNAGLLTSIQSFHLSY
ncbi:Hypothetical protein KVN_LOCUS99 [uncultured virus]|nr:Hypothetical protein KVN_LOCUS99 [uncultured virus]